MRETLREALQTTLLALIVFAGLQATIQNYRVEGSSMEPTLKSNEYLLVNKLVFYRLDMARLARYLPFIKAGPGDEAYVFRSPQRGDVVVFHFPGDPSRDFVKRVVGLPGDTVEIRRGTVYVNGTPLEEPYAQASPRSAMSATKLGPRQYFVLGDNRPNSNDSKDWGPVPEENIVGSVWVTYWPMSQMHLF